MWDGTIWKTLNFFFGEQLLHEVVAVHGERLEHLVAVGFGVVLPAQRHLDGALGAGQRGRARRQGDVEVFPRHPVDAGQQHVEALRDAAVELARGLERLRHDQLHVRLVRDIGDDVLDVARLHHAQVGHQRRPEGQHHPVGRRHADDDVFLAEAETPDALLARLRPVIAAHGVLRVKGFAAVTGKAMRLVVQGVGERLQHYYDRDWRPDELRATRLVFIGETGLDEAAIRAAVAG